MSCTLHIAGLTLVTTRLSGPTAFLPFPPPAISHPALVAPLAPKPAKAYAVSGIADGFSRESPDRDPAARGGDAGVVSDHAARGHRGGADRRHHRRLSRPTGRSAVGPDGLGRRIARGRALALRRRRLLASAPSSRSGPRSCSRPSSALIAVVVLTSMVFWMRKAARSIKRELHALDRRGAAGSRGRPGPDRHGLLRRRARGARVGVLPARDLPAEPRRGAPLGALLGMPARPALGYGIYRGGVRLDLRRFFRWTGVFIIVVAAGLAASSCARCTRRACGTTCRQPAFDLSRVLPVDSGARHRAGRHLRLLRRAGDRRGDASRLLVPRPSAL